MAKVLAALVFPLLAVMGSCFVGVSTVHAAAAPSCAEPPGFDSPYIGHTGSFDGAGGDATGAVRTSEMDTEVAEGLHWTFTQLYWGKFEPNGPTDWNNDPSGAWREFDQYVIAAHARGLNPLPQITVGGNAGAPPSWAGEATSGKSAPANMAALVDFAGKLVARYMPGGSLASAQGWGTCFGVRAWLMDNEPATYETNWSGEAGDYAQFVNQAGQRMHSIDSAAVVLSPEIAYGSTAPFVDDILDPNTTDASAPYIAAGLHNSAGPQTDAVSFHVYEDLLDRPFHLDVSLENAYQQVKAIFDKPAHMKAPGFTYAQKTHYWCTECALDYFTSQEPPAESPTDPYANWIAQFLTRGFALGVDKLTIMDPSAQEQQATHTYVTLLPDPAGMTEVTKQLGDDPNQVRIFRWTSPADGHWVYVAWITPTCVDAFACSTTSTLHALPVTVNLPVRSAAPYAESEAGVTSPLHASGGNVAVQLQPAPYYAPVTFVVDPAVQPVAGAPEAPVTPLLAVVGLSLPAAIRFSRKLRARRASVSI